MRGPLCGIALTMVRKHSRCIFLSGGEHAGHRRAGVGSADTDVPTTTDSVKSTNQDDMT